MAIKFGRQLEATVRFSPAEADRLAPPRLDLTARPRRNRQSEWVRRMVRERVLTADDLIWPLFLVDGERKRVPVSSMPGVERISIDEAVRDAERAAKLRIPCIALFPYTDPDLRDDTGSEALNPDNLVCRLLLEKKNELPDISVLSNVTLARYTSHSHDIMLHTS